MLTVMPTDSWGTISTDIIIPFIKNMHTTLVPSSVVDSLLWIPSKTSDADYITHSEVGPHRYIKCSDIKETDEVFAAVRKQ